MDFFSTRLLVLLASILISTGFSGTQAQAQMQVSWPTPGWEDSLWGWDWKSDQLALDGRVIQLAHVTSDAMPGFSDIRVLVDADAKVVLLQQTTDKGEKREFTVPQLAGGAVLHRAEGMDVLKLVAPNFDAYAGGAIDMVYLSNGITKSFGTFKMELLRNGTEWKLYVNGQGGRVPFTTMFMKANKFFGKVIGIDSVSVK